MSISRQSQLKKNSRKSLEKNGTSTLEQVIYAIRNMPDLLMEYDHEILLDFSCRDEDGQLIKAIREEYRIKAQWLEVYWLDRTELTFELTKTWKKHYKPFAERTNAFWKLAQEVHVWLTSASNIRTLPTICQLPTPLIWVFLCERHLCEAGLKNSGYTANSKAIGKGKLYELACQHYDQTENVYNLNFGAPMPMPPIQALEQTAACIAKQDKDFREGIYLDYQAIQRRCFRKLERGPLKVLVLKEDGSLQIMDRGHDTRKFQNSKKGFG